VKRGTLEHRKLIRLASLLSAERPTDLADALGIIEAICNHFAPRSTPQGDIGKCSDSEIAIGIRTSRDPSLLVQSLVDSEWFDRHPEYRLVIHDWPEHADESVRKYLLRHKLRWLTVSGPRRVTVRTPSRQHLDTVRPPRAGSGTGSGSSKSSEGKGSAEGKPFDRFWAAYPRKKSKPDAVKAFAKLAPDAALLETMLAAIEHQKTWDQWTRDRGQFIPYPATWLNGQQWLDEESAVQVPLLTPRGQQAADAAKEWLRRTMPADPGRKLEIA
jgi:hypothetical protein